MKLYTLKFLLLLSLALLLATCKAQESGLFYSIEQERKLGDNSLDNNLTAGKLLVVDIDKDGKDDYLLAAGRVYNVDVAENALHAETKAGGSWRTDYDIPSDKLCLRIFNVGDTIYGLLFAKNQPNERLMESHLYTLDTSSKEWITEEKLDEKIIEDVEVAGDVLYFSTYTQETLEATGDGEDRIKRTYSLGYYDPSSTGGKVGTIPGMDILPSLYLDAAQGAGGETFLIYGRRIFTGAVPSGITEVEPSDTSLDDIMGDTDAATNSTAFRGIHYSPIYSTFFLSTADGSLWYLDGGKWTLDVKIEDEPFDFADYQLGGTDLFLVGSEDGYYEKSGTLKDSDFVSPSATINKDTYITLDLRKAVINDLFVNVENSSGDGVLFALTSGYGLWSNRRVDGTRVWSQE